MHQHQKRHPGHQRDGRAKWCVPSLVCAYDASHSMQLRTKPPSSGIEFCGGFRATCWRAGDEKHGSSGIAKFFTLLLILGVSVAAFGFWWSRFASGPCRCAARAFVSADTHDDAANTCHLMLRIYLPKEQSHADFTHLVVSVADSAKEFIQEQVAHAWSTVRDFGAAVVDWVREKTSGALHAIGGVAVLVRVAAMMPAMPVLAGACLAPLVT